MEEQLLNALVADSQGLLQSDTQTLEIKQMITESSNFELTMQSTLSTEISDETTIPVAAEHVTVETDNTKNHEEIKEVIMESLALQMNHDMSNPVHEEIPAAVDAEQMNNDMSNLVHGEIPAAVDAEQMNNDMSNPVHEEIPAAAEAEQEVVSDSSLTASEEVDLMDLPFLTSVADAEQFQHQHDQFFLYVRNREEDDFHIICDALSYGAYKFPDIPFVIAPIEIAQAIGHDGSAFVVLQRGIAYGNREYSRDSVYMFVSSCSDLLDLTEDIKEKEEFLQAMKAEFLEKIRDWESSLLALKEEVSQLSQLSGVRF